MKKVLLVIAMVAFGFTANAQENVIKANPLGLAFGIANAGYEFTTTDSQSLTVSGVYYDVLGISGIGAGVEYRFYFDGTAIEGWHAGPSLGYLSLEDASKTSASVFSIGGEVGHQWIFGDHFALDLFAGLGYTAGGDDLSGLKSFGASLGLSVGYAW